MSWSTFERLIDRSLGFSWINVLYKYIYLTQPNKNNSMEAGDGRRKCDRISVVCSMLILSATFNYTVKTCRKLEF